MASSPRASVLPLLLRRREGSPLYSNPSHLRHHGRRLEARPVARLRVLPAEAYDRKREDAALLAAFPLDRGLTDRETLAYAEESDDREPPRDYFMGVRLLVCRFMRLAFEEEADWLVEMLEAERESVAAQAAYALALDREAGG